MKTQYNQAVTMAPVFFDAVGKKAHFEEKDGKKRISYLEDPPAVMLKGENGGSRGNQRKHESGKGGASSGRRWLF